MLLLNSSILLRAFKDINTKLKKKEEYGIIHWMKGIGLKPMSNNLMVLLVVLKTHG